MIVSFIAEYDAETRMDSILYRYMDIVTDYFSGHDYGAGINKICFCPVCRPKELELKQRVRMDNKTKTFYFDIMYEYDYWVSQTLWDVKLIFLPAFGRLFLF